MSAHVDAQRREDALHARVEKSKALLRHFHALIVFELEGLTIRDMARRLSVCPDEVEEWRCYIGLSTSLAPLRRRLANADKRAPKVRRQGTQE